MSHWLDYVVSILKADTSDLRELARFCGASPSTFYLGAELDGVDLSGQDLRGMQFSSLDPNSVKVDSRTQLDSDWMELLRERVTHKSLYEELKQAGRLAYQTREFDRAVELLEEALALRADESEVWGWLGKCLTKLERLDRARRLYSEASDKFPGLAAFRVAEAKVLMLVNDYAEALNVLRSAADIFSTHSGVLTQLAYLELFAGNDAAAEEIRREVWRRYPANKSNRLELARILKKQGRYGDAIPVLRDICLESPGNNLYWNELVDVIRLNGGRRDVVRVLTEMMEDGCKGPALLKLLGATLLEEGRKDEAVALFWEAVDFTETASGPWKWLGDAFVMAGDLRSAVRLYKQAVQQFPDDPAPWKWLGEALQLSGQQGEAISTLREAQRNYPDDPSTWKWLGDALSRAGDAEAIEVFKTAIQRFPGNPSPQKWLSEAISRLSLSDEIVSSFPASVPCGAKPGRSIHQRDGTK